MAHSPCQSDTCFVHLYYTHCIRWFQVFVTVSSDFVALHNLRRCFCVRYTRDCQPHQSPEPPARDNFAWSAGKARHGHQHGFPSRQGAGAFLLGLGPDCGWAFLFGGLSPWSYRWPNPASSGLVVVAFITRARADDDDDRSHHILLSSSFSWAFWVLVGYSGFLKKPKKPSRF